jgi:hypothetical protein
VGKLFLATSTDRKGHLPCSVLRNRVRTGPSSLASAIVDCKYATRSPDRNEKTPWRKSPQICRQRTHRDPSNAHVLNRRRKLRMPTLAKLLISLCMTMQCSARAKADSPFGDLIREQGGIIAIEHVRIIDGTGAPPKSDQTVLIAGWKDRSNRKFCPAANSRERPAP